MRKRRRLADKLTIMVCAVLVAVSAFFYAPMEVSAEESVLVSMSATPEMVDITQEELIEAYADDPSVDLSFVGPTTFVQGYYSYNTDSGNILGSFDFADYFSLDEDKYYSVDVTFSVSISSTKSCCIYPCLFNLDNGNTVFRLYSLPYVGSYSTSRSGSTTKTIYFNGNDTISDLTFSLCSSSTSSSSGKLTINTDIELSNLTEISMTDADKDYLYQQGYDDGYSAGISAETETETFEIDVTSDMSFNNYSVSDANTLLPSVYENEFDSEDENTFNAYFYRSLGVQYVFTPSKDYYGYKVSLVPMGIDYSANGMVEWVRPIIGSYSDVYSGQSGLGYSLDLSTNRTSNLWLETNYSEEDVYFGFLGYFREFVTVENTLRPEGGISGKYRIRITPYSFDEYESATIGLQEQSNILQQTGNDIAQKTQNDMNVGFNDVMNGFNDSHGNSVNNEFSSGLNDFETAEDSLFATATTGMKDFTFFDIQSVPAMVTGMSFVGSIMSGWFAQAGGASGVGIVLSILFSIMLVAMVLGLYRWYQSKGGKD